MQNKKILLITLLALNLNCFSSIDTTPNPDTPKSKMRMRLSSNHANLKSFLAGSAFGAIVAVMAGHRKQIHSYLETKYQAAQPNIKNLFTKSVHLKDTFTKTIKTVIENLKNRNKDS